MDSIISATVHRVQIIVRCALNQRDATLALRVSTSILTLALVKRVMTRIVTTAPVAAIATIVIMATNRVQISTGTLSLNNVHHVVLTVLTVMAD